MDVQSNRVIFSSLGACIEFNKYSFVELLKESGISADLSNSTEQLIDLYLSNVQSNPALLIGSAYFIDYYTSDISFAGEKAVDNSSVHILGRNLYSYFDCENSNEDFSNVNWGNVWGGVRNVAGGLQEGGIAGGIGAATLSIGDEIERKRNPQANRQGGSSRTSYGVDMLQKQQEARNQMIQAALKAQQAKAEAAAKIAAEKRKKKTITYIAIGVGVLAVITIGIVVYVK